MPPRGLRSISRSVVSLLWGIAQAEGKTPSLQTPVLDLLPALADLKKGERERITIEDLLCMRSGLDWDDSGDYRGWGNDENGLSWRGDQARYVFDRPMAAPAATRFNYNGGGTAVLAQLLVQRVGVPLPEYARRKLFAGEYDDPSIGPELRRLPAMVVGAVQVRALA
jgi:CubicO group peptidase (beta-lactamase class C family)